MHVSPTWYLFSSSNNSSNCCILRNSNWFDPWARLSFFSRQTSLRFVYGTSKSLCRRHMCVCPAVLSKRIRHSVAQYWLKYISAGVDDFAAPFFSTAFSNECYVRLGLGWCINASFRLPTSCLFIAHLSPCFTKISKPGESWFRLLWVWQPSQNRHGYYVWTCCGPKKTSIHRHMIQPTQTLSHAAWLRGFSRLCTKSSTGTAPPFLITTLLVHDSLKDAASPPMVGESVVFPKILK